MITVLSWLWLKEPLGIHRLTAVIIGFIGVVIAMRPSGEGQLLGYAYCLVGSLSYALLFISGRWLSKTESVASLVFSFNLGLAIVCTSLVVFVWVTPSLQTLGLVLIFSFLALFGHFFITLSFSKAQVGVIAPFEYTGLFWSVLLGYVLWGDIPDNNVYLGAVIIIMCSLYVIYREAKQRIE